MIPAKTGEHGVVKSSFEHLRLLYPQLSNAADKSYLEMIKEIPFQYDLDNPVVKLKFQSELSKIVTHFDSFTIAEEPRQ